MEDSHIANLDIGDGVSIFGVFDGHGGINIVMLTLNIGAEVAHFVKKYFIKELKKLESFKKKDYKTALNDCFLKMDSLMLTKEGKKEIQKLMSAGDPHGQENGAE
jgi:serine/threonine protein phosphatase PrpC